jgi:hypothetical protein
MTFMATWNLGAVGDVFIDRPDPANAFHASGDALRGFDVTFGNCEGVYTDRPAFAPSADWRVHSSVAQSAGLRPAAFDVMALANNHTLDAGHVGLIDTMTALDDLGIKSVGAGIDLAAARQPAVVETHGVRVGFLAFTSVLQPGYEARAGVPGVAALRVHSHYYIPDWDPYGKIEPGVRPHVRTFAFPDDIAAATAAITALKTEVDVVIVSLHWGTAIDPYHLTDYERAVGHAAIGAGADVVIGHGCHFPRGVEIYRGKPIFYSLGHFVFDLAGLEDVLTGERLKKVKALGPFAIFPREGYPLSPFPDEAHRTMIATVEFDGADIVSTGFIPCTINGDNHALPLEASDPRAEAVVDQVRKATEIAELTTSYEITAGPLGAHVLIT